jgi:predicted transcriptional regulator
MFSVGEDVEADALFKRGWTVSAIARHVDRDRKTVRSYLSGERTPGVRRTDVSVERRGDWSRRRALAPSNVSMAW